MSYYLFNVGNNAKTIKGDGKEYLTAIIYMKPEIYLCPMSKVAGCHKPCLVSAGRGSFNSVKAARQRKSKLLKDNKQEFYRQLRQDIEKFVNYSEKKNLTPVIRLNGTSDYNFYDIIEEYPNVQFYDYSKVYNRVAKPMPKNYHITLSYSEANKFYASKVIAHANKFNKNIAVVFRDKNNIPKTFLGREVINGDKDDLRFLDKKNVVVALYAKGQAIKDKTGFVIDN